VGNPPPAADSGPVANGGFEAGSTTSWNVVSATPDAVSITTTASSGNRALALAADKDYETDVAQTLTQLADGQYLLTAMFRNSGGQRSTWLYAKDCGGAVRQTSVPVSVDWTKVVVRGVQVVGGKCTIGVHTEAAAGQWLTMDDVAFTADPNPPYTLLQGGDLSRLTWIEQLGAKFYDEHGVQKDPMQILADNGFNFVRLRAYNDPGNPNFTPSRLFPPGIETTDDILHLARRAADKGMGIQLTLNYSDEGADGCRQTVPHEWIGMTFPQIRKALYDYTYDIVSRMKAQGTAPAMVSLGNQMQCGLLLDPGKYGPLTNWKQLAELLNDGARAVKAASPESRVMLHIESPAAAGFFQAAVDAGVNFDVLGISWYPYWEKNAGHANTDTLPKLLTALNTIAAKYKRDIVIMEAAVNWAPKTSEGVPGQLVDAGNTTYPETPAGQRDFFYDLMNVCKSVDNGRCLGIQFWDPITVNQKGFGWYVTGGNSTDNSDVFDWNHRALPVLTQAYRNNK
jgi:arabinogalactan endo-1,4-beta-galactosidase